MATARWSFADIRTQAMTAPSPCRPNGFAAQDQSSKCRFPRSALQTSPYDVRKNTKISTTCTYYREILAVRALRSSRTIELQTPGRTAVHQEEHAFSSHNEMVEDSTVGDPAALIPAVLARIEEPSPAKTELEARTSRSCLFWQSLGVNLSISLSLSPSPSPSPSLPPLVLSLSLSFSFLPPFRLSSGLSLGRSCRHVDLSILYFNYLFIFLLSWVKLLINSTIKKKKKLNNTYYWVYVLLRNEKTGFE